MVEHDQVDGVPGPVVGSGSDHGSGTAGGGSQAESTASSPASTEPIRSPTGREVAPGGWRRAVTGVAVGVAAGLLHRVARRIDEDDPRPDGTRVDPPPDEVGS